MSFLRRIRRLKTVADRTRFHVHYKRNDRLTKAHPTHKQSQHSHSISPYRCMVFAVHCDLFAELSWKSDSPLYSDRKFLGTKYTSIYSRDGTTWQQHTNNDITITIKTRTVILGLLNTKILDGYISKL